MQSFANMDAVHKKHAKGWLLLLTGMTALGYACSAKTTPESKLYNDLMKDYNRYTRPVNQTTDTSTVTVNFGLRKIESLDEKKQALTSFVFLTVLWTDPYLTWNPAAYEGAHRLIIPGDQIWIPEIAVLNSVENAEDMSLALGSKFRVEVYPNGLVTWIPATRWVTECVVNLQVFPFDTQTCTITLINWTYKTREMFQLLNPGEVRTSGYTPNNEWILLKASANASIREMAADETNTIQLPTVSMTLVLKRASEYYVLNIVVPCVLMSLMSIMMFWLPPQSGERVSFGITILLSYSVIMLMVSDITPRSGTGIPLLMYYVVMCMVITGLSMCLSICSIHITSERVNGKPVPRWLKSVMYGCVAKIACMCNRVPSVNKKDGVQPLEPEMASISVKAKDAVTLKQMSDVCDGRVVEFSPEVKRLFAKMSEKLQNEEEADANKDEWELVCFVLDRGFFSMLLFTILVTTAGLLTSIVCLPL